MNVLLDISNEALAEAQKRADANRRSRKQELEMILEEALQ